MLPRMRAFSLVLTLALILAGLAGCSRPPAKDPSESIAATVTALTGKQTAPTATAELPTATPTAEPPTATPTVASTPTRPAPTATPEPFAIQDPAFTPGDPQDCTTDATITEVHGNNVSATGTIAFRNNGFVFWCYGARHAWQGTLTYSGYTFASEAGKPLTFVIDHTYGYLYEGGAGVVTLPGGEQVQLPRGGAPAGAGSAPPANPAPATGPVTYLSDLKPVTWKLGYGRFSVGKFAFTSRDSSDNIHAGDPILVNGKEDPHAVFGHAPSKIVYKLDGKYSQFASTIGMVPKLRCGDGAIFKVFVDGREVFTYGPMMPAETPIAIVAELAYGNELSLVTEDGSADDWYCDWAIWGDALLR